MIRDVRRVLRGVGAIGLVLVGVWQSGSAAPPDDGARLLAAYQEARTYPALSIRYPLEGTLFPPDIAPPIVRWDDASAADAWLVTVALDSPAQRLQATTRERQWSPDSDQWETIKRHSRDTNATLTVLGWRRSDSGTVLSRGRVSWRTSRDEVGAPLFYREVNLPFLEAVKDPSRIRWRFGPISSPEPPPIVLQGLPVCGNCHSFPRDGGVLAMDVDYANNKGSYIITPLGRQMVLAPKDIITWDSYHREDREPTFGLLSQISPDGTVVVSTVKDRSVFVPTPDLEFSQLFFPIKGILALYDRKTRTFRPLPGADDPEYVQSNPTWSPDGQYIVFARTKAYALRRAPASNQALLSPAECEEFLKDGKPFQFDLYRIPFNHGQGGTPEPLPGASRNGRSNFFARYSPDGRWIVFCQARNYMLLQPDSELYLMPASGGAPRRLAANTSRMNSWHSWSPNSRWLVFSSKANGPYTQLHLTHIDDQGNSSPPVCLSRLTAPDRAANIPEFVNVAPDAIEHIAAQFLDDLSHVRAGFVCEKTGDLERAIQQYNRTLELNSENPHAHQRLGHIWCNLKRDFDRGLPHSRKAIELDPGNGQAHFLLGLALLSRNDLEAAVTEFESALRLLPKSLSTEADYSLAGTHRYLGLALFSKGDFARSANEFSAALQLEPENPEIHLVLAVALAEQGQLDEPLKHYAKALALKPELGKLPRLQDVLGFNYAKAGRFREAADAARQALATAEAAGSVELARDIRRRLEAYERREVPVPSQ